MVVSERPNLPLISLLRLSDPMIRIVCGPELVVLVRNGSTPSITLCFWSALAMSDR